MDGVVDGVAGLRADLGRVGEVGGCAGLTSLLDRAHEPLDRVVEELDVVEERVGEAELGGLVGAEQPVLLERVRHDQLDGRRRADEAGRELGAAPGRDDPEEDLGEADVAHRAGERAEVAVERDLEAAAERGAVDRGERREGQVADRREGVVTALAPRPARARAWSSSGNSVRSAPTAKTNGLPVRTSPSSRRRAGAARTPCSDSRAARPKTFGFCQSSPLSIVTSATGPTRVATSCRKNCVGLSAMPGVLPEQGGAHAEADAERGQPVADVGPPLELVGELRHQAHAGGGERMAAGDRAAARG